MNKIMNKINHNNYKFFSFEYDTSKLTELQFNEFLNKIVRFEREQFEIEDNYYDIDYCEINNDTWSEMNKMVSGVTEIVSIIHQDSECDLYVVI